MADKEIGDLTAAGALDGTELVHVVQGGNSRRVTTENLYRWAAPAGHVFGLALSNNATDATNDIDVATGNAASDDASPLLIALASGLTKRIDAAWVVGTNQGGLDTGSVADGVYYVWLIQRSDTGVVDVLFSTSSTAPTMPTSYDRKARIGSFARSTSNKAPRSYGDGETTAWVDYVPSSQSFGTIGAINSRSRRNGSNLEYMINFQAGTVTGVQARIGLGFGGDDGNVTIASWVASGGQALGTWGLSATAAVAGHSLAVQGETFLRFAYQASGQSGLASLLGTSTGGNSIFHSLQGSVPIEGW